MVVGLFATAAGAAPPGPVAAPAGVQPVETPSPTVTAPAATVPASEPGAPAVGPQIDRRTGGSDPAPGRGKPAWAWWALGAVGLLLAVGALRLWRSMAE